MNDSVIVYGPKGCGKTTHAETLRKHYGLEHIVDDYQSGARMRKDVLYLCVNPPSENSALEKIPFESAMAAVRTRGESANVAAVHKKYDTLFRKLMDDMTGEMSKALDTENVCALALRPKAEFDCSSSASCRRIDALFLTRAEIEFSIKYGDSR